MRKAIAIDFDGCLCSNFHPGIGAPNWEVIERAKAEQREGAGLILWTYREGKLLQDAVEACQKWGLLFDAINESLPDWIAEFGTTPRKVGATEYWDDRAVQLEAPAVTMAQSLICDYYEREALGPADFSDPTNVGLAYTQSEDEMHKIQVSVDLVALRLISKVDDKIVEELRYESMEDLCMDLEYVDFDVVIADAIMAAEKMKII